MSTPPSETPPQPPYTREQWRDWRRSQRRGYWGGRWAWFWGLVLIVLGGYSLLRSLGLLPSVRSDIILPSLVIALGLWLIIERGLPRRGPD